MFGFNQRAMPGQTAPWSGLPTAQTPWQPTQQSPWRMTPWQTQAMPAATPIQQAPLQTTQQASPYLSQGTSASLPNFNPMTPGGGFYPTQPQQQTQAPMSGGDLYYSTSGPGAGGGQEGLNRFTSDPYAPGYTFGFTPEVAQKNPYLAAQLPLSNPLNPYYDQATQDAIAGMDQYNPSTWFSA